MGGQDLSWLDFEVDGALDEQWVVVEHALKVSSHELILNVVATIVQTAGTDVATRALQTMSLRLHLRKVSVLNSLSQRFERRIQWEDLQLAEHLVENLGLVAEQNDGFRHVDGSLNREVHYSVHGV